MHECNMRYLHAVVTGKNIHAHTSLKRLKVIAQRNVIAQFMRGSLQCKKSYDAYIKTPEIG